MMPNAGVAEWLSKFLSLANGPWIETTLRQSVAEISFNSVVIQSNVKCHVKCMSSVMSSEKLRYIPQK